MGWGNRLERTYDPDLTIEAWLRRLAHIPLTLDQAAITVAIQCGHDKPMSRENTRLAELSAMHKLRLAVGRSMDDDTPAMIGPTPMQRMARMGIRGYTKKPPAR